MTTLLDELAQPTLRTVLGSLLSRAAESDFAITRIRLAAIDLAAGELGRTRQCRVLLGRLDANLLRIAPTSSPHDGLAATRRLTSFARSGRLLVRSCPRHAWYPDFSILRDLTDNLGQPAGDACLIGSHWFREPNPPDGPALTALIRNPSAIRHAEHRFNDLWDAAHDVLPAVNDALDHLAGSLERAFHS
jgi:hypothetical protein